MGNKCKSTEAGDVIWGEGETVRTQAGEGAVSVNTVMRAASAATTTAAAV